MKPGCTKSFMISNDSASALLTQAILIPLVQHLHLPLILMVYRTALPIMLYMRGSLTCATLNGWALHQPIGWL